MLVRSRHGCGRSLGAERLGRLDCHACALTAAGTGVVDVAAGPGMQVVWEWGAGPLARVWALAHSSQHAMSSRREAGLFCRLSC
jgi:hypothetical protein